MTWPAWYPGFPGLDGQSYMSLTAAFNNVGISSDSAVSTGNLDGYGDSYPAQALPLDTTRTLAKIAIVSPDRGTVNIFAITTG